MSAANLAKEVEGIEFELAIRGGLLDRVRHATGAGMWHDAVDLVEVAMAGRDHLQQRIADLEEQLRVVTGQRVPSEVERARLSAAVEQITSIVAPLLGLCPTCRGEGRIIDSVVYVCPDCDGLGRVAPGDEPSCPGGCSWVEDPEGGDPCSACERAAKR